MFDFLSLLLVEFFGLASPGPDVFYVMRTSASQGRANAMRVVLGIMLGNAFWLLAVALGLAIVFNRYPLVATGLLTLGAAYLFYIGYRMFKGAQNLDLNQVMQNTQPDNSLVWRALTVNLANVKAVFYISAIMSAFVGKIPNGYVVVPLTMLVCSAVWFTAVAMLFSLPKVKNAYARNAKAIDKTSGVIFMVLGVVVIYQALHSLIL